ncbi:hypothetical protein D3878_10255 [Noviherbaspirillum sedimenti]|uniref:Uncharacterized protein n=2 Tax=Noviherbaspirillum sedimenti TaxID=2320865 RepID=A0A3A3G218_9BURK|nr:hypothetical protein D3878_10255 [Noviherbaspirillum sedimenti]
MYLKQVIICVQYVCNTGRRRPSLAVAVIHFDPLQKSSSKWIAADCGSVKPVMDMHPEKSK